MIASQPISGFNPFIDPPLCMFAVNSRLSLVRDVLHRWNRQRHDVHATAWSFPPVIALVSALDWNVLQLSTLVSGAGENCRNLNTLAQIDQHLSDVESTVEALQDLLLTSQPPYGQPI